MYDRLEIFQMAYGLATNAAARQGKIAGNMANANTPGYRAQDILPFSETYRAQNSETTPRRTRPGHLAGQTGSAAEIGVVDRPGAASPNGNTVSLENEMVNAVEVKRAHDLALQVYQTSLGILRSSLGRGR